MIRTAEFARRLWASVIAWGVLLALSGCTVPPPDIVAVPSVDLARYSGEWFEVARIPTSFEDAMGRKCTDVRARYTLRDDGRLDIHNTCRNLARDGAIEVSDGVGRAADDTGARLLVTFLWPFSAPYWVIGLDADYRWAVVGVPSRRYLWVLSRTPELPEADLEAALAIAAAQNFDLSHLVKANAAP